MENHSQNILENKWLLLFISLIYLIIITQPDSIGWIISPFYLIVLATYLTKSRSYGYNFYSISSLFSIVLECLLLVYVYLFDSTVLKVPVNLAWFLGTIILTLFLILFYIHSIITGKLKSFINKPSKNSENTVPFNERSLKQMKEGNLVIILAFASAFVAFLLMFIKPSHFVHLLILGTILFMVGLLMISLKIFESLRSAGFKI